MGNLPRLELDEQNSNLKNNDFIIFRNQNKGKNISKKINIKKKHSKKRVYRKTKKTRKHHKKSFFGIF